LLGYDWVFGIQQRTCMTTPDNAVDAKLVGLYRYPVKGLSPERLSSAMLEPGQTLACDRAWAIENGPGRFDPAKPAHLPKINFLMLMRNERLALLETKLGDDAKTLSIARKGRTVVTGDLTTRAGRAVIEQFLAQFMQGDLRGPPRIVSSPGHSFSDVSAKCLHIINLASLRELERLTARHVDALRFRPNLVIDGAPAWAEFQWVGRELAIGGARLRVLKRTERCAATNVDPASGARDMDIPAQLARGWGHTDFGIYASVVSGGKITPGDAVAPPR
jgi:hypothetical protein